MLHATLRVAQPLGLSVLALHVHHGLSAHADEWRQHGAETCLGWSRAGLPVRFVAHSLEARPARGESVEAWARQQRYRALRCMAVAGGADLVLLAHHRRDQAETFLLQALRGGGVASLSAMPREVRRDGVTWARPWLEKPADAIDDYVRRHRLRHIDDDTNGDSRFARNRLRAEVWPALIAAFPDAEASIAAAAGWAQAASALLDAQAEVDLASIVDSDVLDLAAWRSLPDVRRGNAMRVWLRQRLHHAAPASLVIRLLREADTAGAQRWPAPGGELRSYRGRLRYRAEKTGAGAPALLQLDLSKPGSYPVDAWHGTWLVDTASSQGLSLASATELQMRRRRPGDRFQAGKDRPPRSLKLQYQAAGVPAWQRDGPVLCRAGKLVFAEGLGIDAGAWAANGEPQVRLIWRPA